MRAVFMGTPGFASTILDALLESRHPVVGVVTRPDRPSGRGRRPSPSPVAVAAAARGLPVVKPENASDPVFREALREWSPDVAAVAAFGLILRKDILEMPRRGCVNVHASLLPLYRGAAPIQQAIIDGCAETGITTMLMEEGLDSGPILLQERVPILPDETAGELERRLADVGARLLVQTLDELEAGTVNPVPQDDSRATWARSLGPEAGDVLFAESAAATHNRIRGCTPRPGARAYLAGAPVRIWRSALMPQSSPEPNAAPGTILAVSGDGLAVACGDGCPIMLCEVQPAGRGRMSGAAFARGRRLKPGERFDNHPPADGD